MISHVDQAKVFDAFIQTGDQQLARQGTGLGLPIKVVKKERYLET